MSPKEMNMALKPMTRDGRESVKPRAEGQSQDDSVGSSREEEIRRRAYEIYLGRREEPGYEIAGWLQAERELMADRSEHSLGSSLIRPYRQGRQPNEI